MASYIGPATPYNSPIGHKYFVSPSIVPGRLLCNVARGCGRVIPHRPHRHNRSKQQQGNEMKKIDKAHMYKKKQKSTKKKGKGEQAKRAEKEKRRGKGRS